jgi:hypothetical protein
MQLHVKMLQKLQDYKWHILIGISVIIVIILMYQSYSANKKINMLYRCINELSCRIEDVADTVTVPVSGGSRPPQPSQSSQTPKRLDQKTKQGGRGGSGSRQPQPQKQAVSPQVKVSLPPQQARQSPQRHPPQPVVSETIIFQVAPSPQQQRNVTASTIEEIDSDDDSDVEVEQVQMKDVDLDKALEAELSELNE